MGCYALAPITYSCKYFNTVTFFLSAPDLFIQLNFCLVPSLYFLYVCLWLLQTNLK